MAALLLLSLLIPALVQGMGPLPTRTIGGDLYSATPAGWVLSHCVHEVPHGARTSHDANGALIVRHASLPQDGGLEQAAKEGLEASAAALPPDYDGWLQYTVANTTGGGYDGFDSVMSVPDTPAARPHILYLFPGLQNIDWIPKVDPEPTASNPFDIIQPVLQYPGTRPGKWGVRSWYVTIHSGALMSTELPVAAGDAIVCNMTRTGEFAWFIGSTVRSSGLQTNQRVDVAHKGAAARLRQQPWAYTTTECYGCRGCSTFPTEPLHFTDMSLRSAVGHVTPAWMANVKPARKAECHEATVIHNASAVTMTFQ